jgi:hypothetical protein
VAGNGIFRKKQCQKTVLFGDFAAKFSKKGRFWKGDSGKLVRILWMFSGGVGRK